MTLADTIAVACALGCFYFGLLWLRDAWAESDWEFDEDIEIHT